MTQTKHLYRFRKLLADFIVGVAPAFVIILLPTFAVGLLFDPPFDAIGMAVILFVAAFFTPWSPWPVLFESRARRRRTGLRSRPAR